MQYYDSNLEKIYRPDIEIFYFDLIKDHINKIVRPFFMQRGIEDFKLLSNKVLVSDLLFKKLDFCFFYDELFGDVSEGLKKKYILSINEEMTKEYCEKSNMKYSTINLYNQPVLYIFHFKIEQLASMVEEELRKMRVI